MKNVKAWLRQQKMTQGEFSRRLGTDRYQVSRWMRGRIKPSVPTLKKISSVTGIPIGDLV